MADLLGRFTRMLRPWSGESESTAKESLQVFRYLAGPLSTLDQRLVVGQALETQEICRLTLREREAHLYCAGITGSGKTRWLQHLIYSDIATGQPVVVLDPFGGLYRGVREWVASGLEQAMAQGFDGRMLLSRYRFLDLNDPENPIRCNPLAAHPLETIEQQVDDLMKAVERILGGTLEEQRKLRNVLRGVFSLTAQLNRLPPETLPPYVQPLLPLTPGFGAEILNMDDQQRLLLLNLVRQSGSSDFRRQYWQFFSGLSAYERNQLVQSSWNVFQYLLDDDLASRFFGPVSTLDLPQLLQEGTSLICFLPVGANLAGARLVGKYLTTKLQHSAYRRPPEERERRLHLYLDEFHQWCDQSFADALTNLRQFGIQVTCAHQSQTQPPFDTTDGRALLRTIQSNSRLKAIFRLARPDAEDLARELFELSQQKPNFEVTETSAGTTEQTALSRGHSTSTSTGNRSGRGQSQSQQRDARDSLTVGHSRTQTSSSEYGSQNDQRETTTSGTSRSTTRRTVYFTLEGEREQLINDLQRLPQRHFYLAAEPLRGHLLETPFVPDELYHYAGANLPEELMAWQRHELAAGVAAAEKTQVLIAIPNQRALEQPAESWEVVEPDRQVVEVEPDEDDPFLD